MVDGIIQDLQRYGGITVLFKELVSKLIIKKEKFQYVSYANEPVAAQLSSADTCEVERRHPRLFERYRDCFVEGDVFHSSYYRLPVKKIPTVTTVYDFTYEKYVSGPAKWVHSWQKNRAIQNSDIVICISESTASDVMKYSPIDDQKLRIIHPGVSDNYFPLAIEQRVVSSVVLFIGSRAEYKNFRMAVIAVSSIACLTLTIVGGGALNKTETEMLNALLPGRYLWHSWLSETDLNSIYNIAYCLMYPSSYEGFGIPVAEAMRAGCPVIAVNTSSIPEVAGAAALLAQEVVEEEFVELLLLLSKEKERNKYIDMGYAQARKFSWDKCFEETLNVYRTLGLSG